MREVGTIPDSQTAGKLVATSSPVTSRQFNLRTMWDFRAAKDEVCDVAFDIDAISSWCGRIFLQMQTVAAPNGQGIGQHVQASTKGLMPHSFAFSGMTSEYVEGRLLRVEISGDFEGTAVLEVASCGDQTRATFNWSVDCRHALIGPLSRLAPQLLIWNHRWAVRQACLLMQNEIDRRRENRPMPTVQPVFPHNIRLLRAALCRQRTESVAVLPHKRLHCAQKSRAEPGFFTSVTRSRG